MGARAGLDGGKSHPTGIRSPDRPALSQSLHRLSYRAHNYQCTLCKVSEERRRQMYLLTPLLPASNSEAPDDEAEYHVYTEEPALRFWSVSLKIILC